MSKQILKQLNIKSSACNRLLKDKNYYDKEAQEQIQVIEKLKKANEDSAKIKKQEEVLQETLLMIPDCINRLKHYHSDLKKLLDEIEEQSIIDSQEFQNAKKVFDNIQNFLNEQEQKK
ncbi:tubulin-specific chaperone a [Anaeramoeba ignava]|uniref:Tubulin-specific chaperone A n=1 Tax=Anaeramoeba ignava TaxID=1746090 RepID=A0A9Q0LTA0_ANAIG|nr:tubulin-specific chaperone a [Anaeramoeba ignava]